MIHENLSPEITAARRERIGFNPEILVNAVGVSFEGRQALLAKAYRFCGPDASPPCYLERQPDNEYDPNAVAVYLGVDYSKVTGWDFKHVGFLPKDYQINGTNVSTIMDCKSTRELQ